LHAAEKAEPKNVTAFNVTAFTIPAHILAERKIS
jgi:hypothetical protein